jgi:hypothetical protein
MKTLSELDAEILKHQDEIAKRTESGKNAGKLEHRLGLAYNDRGRLREHGDPDKVADYTASIEAFKREKRRGVRDRQKCGGA